MNSLQHMKLYHPCFNDWNYYINVLASRAYWEAKSSFNTCCHISLAVLKSPPYAVSEHGYGSFFLPIEVYFKNKIEPRKLQFDYDLILPAFGSLPIDNIRSEALTFTNPTDEFKRKLVKGGGIVTKTTTTNGFHRYCKLGCFGFTLLVQAVLYLLE